MENVPYTSFLPYVDLPAIWDDVASKHICGLCLTRIRSCHSLCVGICGTVPSSNKDASC